MSKCIYKNNKFTIVCILFIQIDEASDAEKQRKDYKSDSEIYTDLKSSGRRTKQDPEKYKKIHLDER